MSESATADRIADAPPGEPAADRVPDAVTKKLAEESYRFDFFQAVRLLGVQAQRESAAGASHRRYDIGGDVSPDEETVRFRAVPSHTFPAGTISKFLPSDELPPSKTKPDQPVPAEMVVSHMGLTGPAGALPQHYTQTIIQRLKLKDYALRDFLDLFNHRLVSHFYRAWQKYQLPVLYEAAALREKTATDPVTWALYCLVGLGTPGMRNRLEVADEAFLYYAGHFSHQPKNATSLERMVSAYVGARVTLTQFEGQWLQLDRAEQTALPTVDRPGGLNTALGVTAVAGERVWSMESKFRLRLGPLPYDTFRRYMPRGENLVPLGQLVRMYVGPDLDFDIQPVLHRREVPACQLGATEGDPAKLGWNTWVCSRPMKNHAEDAVFISDGLPTR